MQHKRYKAALVEYQKAKDPDEPMSPTALARMAECHVQLGDLVASNTQLTTALGLYPENVKVLLTAAELAPKVGLGDGHQYWLRAHEVNPYNIQTQAALVKHYELNGNEKAVRHHEYILSILEVGGLYSTVPNP